MKKKIFLLIVAALLVLIGSGIIYFKHRITPPSAAVLKSLAATEKRPSGYYFPGESDKPLIIVNPGALIDVRSYSVWASALARKGYPVYLIEMPLEFSFFASSKADQALAEIKPQTYIIGHHRRPFSRRGGS
ncbi:alpha/beta hydrolase [Enterococcus hirae]|nr:alpha/beta hydrolase [Enterococcus hirae]